MIAHLHHRGWHYLLLIAMAGLVFFLNLGGAALWDVDEGRNADCAFEMMQADNWIVPTFNGNLRIDKPALLYWLQISSYSLFGVNEFAARFPSALAALFTVLAAYELARAMFGRATGLCAGVILATTPMLVGAARFANPDALLNLFTTLTLAVFWIGLEQRRWWWFLLLGACSGLAVLAKGPVGLVLPSAVNVAFLLWERRLRVFWDWRWLGASAVFALVALPWYIWVGLETHGEFLTGFLWTHNLERGMSAMDLHAGFPGYYLVVLTVGTAPWSLLAWAAVWFGFWSALRTPWTKLARWWSASADARSAATPEVAAAYRLLLCWIAVYLVFFSIAATKLPNYVLPTLTPLAVLVGRLLERWRTGEIAMPAWFRVLGVVLLASFGIGLGIGLAMVPAPLDDLRYFAPLGVVPVGAAVAVGWLMRNRRVAGLVGVLCLTAVLLLTPLAGYASAVFNRCKAAPILAEQAALLQPDRDIRIGCYHMEHLPSLNFYVHRNVEHLPEEKAIAGFLGYGVPAYLFLPAEDWRRLESKLPRSIHVLGESYDLYHRTDFVVVTNGAP